MRIQVQKIGVVAGGLPANDRAVHIDGQEQDENVSLPVEYTAEGELIGEIKVGRSVVIDRDTRNGVKMPGIFQSSTVTEVTATQFKTRNSVYNYKFLKG
jgi:hypothetical protein